PLIKANFNLADLRLAEGETSHRAGASKETAPSFIAANNDTINWRTVPIHFDGLQTINANISLLIQKLFIKGLPLHNAKLNLLLENGIFTLHMPVTSLEEGQLSFNAKIDSNYRPTKFFADLKLTKVQAKTLLQSLAGIERFSGITEMNLHLNSMGNSEKTIVEHLSGKGSLIVKNGAFRGINLSSLTPDFVSLMQRLRQTGNESTPFDTLLANFVIKNGVIENPDLLIRSPAISIAGQGKVNLPASQISYHLMPKHTSDLSPLMNGTLMVVEGPLLNPGIKVDLEKLLQQLPKKMPEQWKKLPKNGKELKGVLKDEMQHQLRQLLPLPAKRF
ncbi:MAG: AsmA family protein, partial [Burkholderiales bacterium]